MPSQVDTDFSNDNDVRAILIVHDTKPPFLDGRVSYTKQAQAVLPLRDPTSDMAVIARNGSHLVKEVREKKEKNKSRARFWEMAGSKIGKITGGQASPHFPAHMPCSLLLLPCILSICPRHSCLLKQGRSPISE